MTKIRVLIVDDSITYRSLLKTSLDNLENIEVIGVASNGKIALEKLKVQPVDLVILDLEMPEMDGITLLKKLKENNIVTKIILFSSQTQKGASITLEGLSLGASDFVTKPHGGYTDNNPQDKIRSLLIPKIRGIFDMTKEPSPKAPVAMSDKKHFTESFWGLYRPKIIVIGSSTGGPMALEKVFAKLKGPLRCPIIIVQHMPPIFTATLAERLGKLTGIAAAEAQDKEELKNRIYVAPGNFHLRLTGSRAKPVLMLDQNDHINFVRPAVDPLFQTASDLFKEGCLGIVLTGMGQDGKDGTVQIKNNDGVVIIQNPESCVVFGMPGAVKTQGSFDFIKTPEELSDILVDKAQANF